MRSKLIFFALLGACVLISGCRTWLIDQTDRSVYQLIEHGQEDALGEQHDARVGLEAGDLGDAGRIYRKNPRPLEASLPESFQTSPTPPEDHLGQPEKPGREAVPSAEAKELSLSIFSDSELDQVTVFSLQDTLTYAMRHARDLQTAKEALYLAALDLLLQRHLWTPQFVASVDSTFVNRPDTEDPDHPGSTLQDRAMQTISDLSLSQRLPYGGAVTARVIHEVVRTVTDAIARGNSGQVLLQADIPLLRGAGRSAETYESLLSAERELIYAVRTYERFRRTFLVDVATGYFDLQQLKAAIANTYTSYLSRKEDWEKADFIHRVGRSRTVFDAPRAKANLRSAEAQLVSAKERYETALDRFKILLGMPVDTLLDIVDQEKDEESRAVDDLLPALDEATAVAVALRYRLDLLNSADAVDDTRRGVRIAQNRILPDLNLTGSVIFDSDAGQLRPTNLSEDRVTWQGGAQLRLDDRWTERNAYRASLIAVRRASRDHEEFTDTVRADVRRALRRVAQQEDLKIIQELNVAENESRFKAARAQFDLGRASNQDVVDAENDLLRARNDFAAAVSDYRVAILQFRRDTGTLRITDDGRWGTPDEIDASVAPIRPQPR